MPFSKQNSEANLLEIQAWKPCGVTTKVSIRGGCYMRHGYLNWVTPEQAAAHLTASLWARGAALKGTDEDKVPLPVELLSTREKLVFLLHVAAEVEHALLVQYLFAYFSLGTRARRTDLNDQQKDLLFKSSDPRGWAPTILDIAKEEMGHLLSVQNLLLALGGPVTLEREDFPFRSDLYPFEFSLQPLTKDSLARFVAAERPREPKLLPGEKPDDLEKIIKRAAGANQAMPINRVGPLYATIIDLVNQLDKEQPSDPDLKKFWFETAKTFQADPDQAQDGWNPGYPDLILSPVSSPAEMIAKLLKPIAEQGEGPMTSGPDNSHYVRFRLIYDAFPETNPAYGKVEWLPALAVAADPNTAPVGKPLPGKADGQITKEEARAWAILFNHRYRMLLSCIAFSLRLDKTTSPQCRKNVVKSAFNEMTNVLTLARELTLRNCKHDGAKGKDGRVLLAGPPFELPYTVNLPSRDAETWQLFLDLIVTSDAKIDFIMKQGWDPTQVLPDIKKVDAQFAKWVKAKLHALGADCPAIES
jgi:hypothetical protein